MFVWLLLLKPCKLSQLDCSSQLLVATGGSRLMWSCDLPLLYISAPPEFIQWPQSVSRPAGGSAVFSCMASGVPEPHLIWLKNGKLLVPSGNVKLTNGNT